MPKQLRIGAVASAFTKTGMKYRTHLSDPHKKN